MKIRKNKSRTLRYVVLGIFLVFSLGLLLADLVSSKGLFQSFPQWTRGVCSAVIYLPPQSSVVAKQHNFHVVAPGVWRSAQPNRESILRMKSYGLKTIVNLRGDSEAEHWERNLTKDLGIQYYHFPMDARQKTLMKTLNAILSVVSDPARQPVLVHCHAGKDRTGLVIAAYKLGYTRESFPDIYQEMLMYGYAEKEYPAILDSLKKWCVTHQRPEIVEEIETQEKIIQDRNR